MDTEKMNNRKPKNLSFRFQATQNILLVNIILFSVTLYRIYYHNAPGTALGRFLYRFLYYIIYVYIYIFIFTMPIVVVLDRLVSWIKVCSLK